MTQWYVKELSKLTQVSVQALHHYDRIGLLEPSVRLANGYRLYSEKDLLKLQQILALKFFGFTLTQIKTLLCTDVKVMDHFTVQSQLLEEKAQMMFAASHALKTIVVECNDNTSIPWETILKLMEVYRMTQQLEQTWAGKVLSQEELSQYARFEHGLSTRFTTDEKKDLELGWDEIVNDVNANVEQDPTSDIGIALGKRCMEWVNRIYGKEFIVLRTAIWEKGFKGGNIGAEHNLSPQAIAWLDTAMDSYCRNRIYSVLKQVGAKSVSKQWEALLTDMYGDEQSLKNALIVEVLNDDNVSDAAKIWLKEIK